MSRLDLSVYLVTDRGFGPEDQFWGRLEEALDAGVTCLQVREKGSARQLYETALRILPLARSRGIPLIVNDRLDVAMAVGADGVHLGQSDLDAGAARRLWGPGKWIGVSARTVDEIRKAEDDGADHLGIGAVFATSTKADAEVLPPGALAKLVAATRLPTVGIGGITVANAAQVFEAGCRGVAVVSAVWAAPNPADAVRALKAVAGRFRR